MAATKITVKTEDLTSAAAQIENLADDYESQYRSFYNKTDAMKSAWDDAGNRAFIDQIAGFEDDFKKMYTLMNRYATFLRNTAKTYESLQEQIIIKAKNLRN